MDEILRAFPASNVEALAYLYVQNQDLTGLSPEEIWELYNDACNRIAKRASDDRFTGKRML